MEDTIAFTKTKRDGTVVKKKMPVFRHGDWKDWLNWLLHVQEHSTFMRYTLSQEDQFALADDMQLLLFEEDLRQFNDVVREEAQNRPDVAVAGIRQLTMRHCPPETRGAPMDELAQLRKKKGVTPVDCQVEVNRISRRWELSAMEAQFELIERNERDEALLRNSRAK
ncbi:hypothetical protein PHYSODRAFT_318692 [Phytophthora sojae]|uniref:Uncharacterized protein n=1 Tax=Phytophthora sojae (strain P6497) TaxID=1094619 RepID=G5A5Y7_PHYSP|nr:hypothetical protein PHYSODRAFT_318692 [Phytophthora sojae]EGZ08742.1 hypothetical protein PHYSODRAFT_318692 [Phytophthora sojae]|eukprot:XP_009535375.1 hypothetical protein PHYSODRAFT_318692 [Phytophthora sojae]